MLPRGVTTRTAAVLGFLIALGGRLDALQDDQVRTVVEVNGAIARGVRFLAAQQREDGHWPGHEDRHPGGLTALATFALVKSGCSERDPTMRRALTALPRTTFRSTYSHAVRLMLLEALAQPERDRALAQESLDFLVANQARETGLWAYPDGAPDVSNTQFALLGLRSAAHLGLLVNEGTLLGAVNGLTKTRDADGRGLQTEAGAFSYIAANNGTGGITAATLAGWIALEELGARSNAVKSLMRSNKKAMAAAQAWLERRLRLDANPVNESAWTPGFHYAHLYAIERYCGFSGRERLGGRDWYQEGARWLLSRQRADGGWGEHTEDTCFALLFLRRASVTANDDATERILSGQETFPEREFYTGPAELVDVPWTTDWLLCGPFQSKLYASALDELEFAPEKLRPKAGQKLSRRTFERAKLQPSGWTDLDALTGRGTDHSLWVLGTELEVAPGRELEAVLCFTFEDGWSVWLDGKELTRDRRVAAPIRDDTRCAVRLAPGRHTLVVLVEDDFGAAAFGLCIAKPSLRGSPEGLRAGVVGGKEARDSR